MTNRPFVAVYMMSNRIHGTLYLGVTSDLLKRATEHREGLRPGFTKTYGLTRLVWWEWHQSIREAIRRETSMKRYPREWKLNLVERDNPHWEDRFDDLVALLEGRADLVGGALQ